MNDEARKAAMKIKEELSKLPMYVMWQYCNNLDDINKAIEEQDENWIGLKSPQQIIGITYDVNHGCYLVLWIYEETE